MKVKSKVFRSAEKTKEKVLCAPEFDLVNPKKIPYESREPQSLIPMYVPIYQFTWLRSQYFRLRLDYFNKVSEGHLIELHSLHMTSFVCK